MALDDDLISFWELEESSGTRVDAHGSNDLTDNNTVTSATGKVGTAADFVAANFEFLSHASNASLQMGDIDFTICAWIYLVSPSTAVLVAKDLGTSGNQDYTLDFFIKFRFYINGTGGVLVDNTTPSTDTWYFLVAWHDAAANTLNLQVDNGTAASVGTSGAVPDVSSTAFNIGARVSSGFERWITGRIDQVGIWKRVLTSDERTTLYNSGNGVTYSSFGGGGGGGSVPRALHHLREQGMA